MDPIWPDLPLQKWQSTYETLHRWTQIIGKIRLKLAPKWNHWWHTTLYLTARGLTTSPMPYRGRLLQIDFDFIDHQLVLQSDNGASSRFDLRPYSVAHFYRELMDHLRSLGFDISIWTVPVEIEDRTRFEEDEKHCSYDAEYAHRNWKILLQTDRILKQFRSRFTGKVSPVHFFWGSFDIAVTRFSGRRGPRHPGSANVGVSVMVEAYSHEVSSCGFWPGAGLGEPAFYCYAYPEPEKFKDYSVQAPAYYHPQFQQFLLPYAAVRSSESPDDMLLIFFQSTYEAAANLGSWDRASLESNY